MTYFCCDIFNKSITWLHSHHFDLFRILFCYSMLRYAVKFMERQYPFKYFRWSRSRAANHWLELEQAIVAAAHLCVWWNNCLKYYMVHYVKIVPKQTQNCSSIWTWLEKQHVIRRWKIIFSIISDQHFRNQFRLGVIAYWWPFSNTVCEEEKWFQSQLIQMSRQIFRFYLTKRNSFIFFLQKHSTMSVSTLSVMNILFSLTPTLLLRMFSSFLFLSLSPPPTYHVRAIALFCRHFLFARIADLRPVVIDRCIIHVQL